MRFGRLARQAAEAADRIEAGERIIVIGDRLGRAVRAELARRQFRGEYLGAFPPEEPPQD